MKRYRVMLLVILLSGCATQKQKEVGGSDASVEQLVNEGYAQLVQNNTQLAINNYFNKAIEKCAYQYGGDGPKFYAARTQADTLAYMLLAASKKQEAKAVPPACADALFLKGYANIDLGNIDVAEEYLKRAIDMAPFNSHYLSELGHVDQTKGDWSSALDIFSQAEKYANEFSPPALKQNELLRAKRGIGFSLIEKGRLDEAETKFKECLAIDANDAKALNELKYIEQLRRKKSAGRV